LRHAIPPQAIALVETTFIALVRVVAETSISEERLKDGTEEMESSKP